MNPSNNPRRASFTHIPNNPQGVGSVSPVKKSEPPAVKPSDGDHDAQSGNSPPEESRHDSRPPRTTPTTKDSEFHTTDRLMAAFLLVRGNQLLGVRPDENNEKAVFVFRNSERLVLDTKDFMENAPAPVRTMARKMAQLRDACRDLRRGPALEKTYDRPKYNR